MHRPTPANRATFPFHAYPTPIDRIQLNLSWNPNRSRLMGGTAVSLRIDLVRLAEIKPKVSNQGASQ